MDTQADRSKDIEAQATRWIVRLDAARSPELTAEHARWMAESARHRIAYTKLRLAWRRMDVLRRVRPLDPAIAADPDLLKPRGSRGHGAHFMLDALRSAWVPRLVIGAAVVAVFAFGAAALFKPDAQLVYSTPIGGRQHVTLDDGSVLDLNTNSSVRVQFTAARRKIVLDRGELLLSVAHDASRPLEVVAGDVITRAVGTKFSVRRYENDSVETLITEGRVLVLEQQRVLGVPMTSKPLVRTLSAGERVLVDTGAAHVTKPTAQEIEHSLQWTSGRISFHQEKLSNVVRELNRYNVRQLVIVNPRIAGIRIGGGFDTARAEAYSEDLTNFFGPGSLVPMQTPSAQ